MLVTVDWASLPNALEQSRSARQAQPNQPTPKHALYHLHHPPLHHLQDPMTSNTPVAHGRLAAGLPKRAGKARQMQAFVSVIAGWFARYVPPVYNAAIRPTGVLLLTASTYLCKHLVQVRTATVPTHPTGFAALLAITFDVPLRALELVIQAASGLPDHQPIQLWNRPIPSHPKERTIAEAHNAVKPLVKAKLDLPVPDLYAHRGASFGEFPENTLRSFERAVETADAMETGTSSSPHFPSPLNLHFLLMVDG